MNRKILISSIFTLSTSLLGCQIQPIPTANISQTQSDSSQNNNILAPSQITDKNNILAPSQITDKNNILAPSQAAPPQPNETTSGNILAPSRATDTAVVSGQVLLPEELNHILAPSQVSSSNILTPSLFRIMAETDSLVPAKGVKVTMLTVEGALIKEAVAGPNGDFKFTEIPVGQVVRFEVGLAHRKSITLKALLNIPQELAGKEIVKNITIGTTGRVNLIERAKANNDPLAQRPLSDFDTDPELIKLVMEEADKIRISLRDDKPEIKPSNTPSPIQDKIEESNSTTPLKDKLPGSNSTPTPTPTPTASPTPTPSATPTPSNPVNHSVNFDGNFSPTNLTINVGDSVTWTNNTNIVRILNSSEFSAQNLAKNGGNYTHTFNAVGSFNATIGTNSLEITVN